MKLKPWNNKRPPSAARLRAAGLFLKAVLFGVCWFSHSKKSVATRYLLELSLTCFWTMRLNPAGGHV